MTIAERRRQQFFRSKVQDADREQIAILVARFVEGSEEIMSLALMIENAIDRKLALLEQRNAGERI